MVKITTLAVALVAAAGLAAQDPPGPWPRVERYDIELELSPPRRLVGRARVSLAEVTGNRVALALNPALQITGVSDAAGGACRVVGRSPLFATRYHRERTAALIELPAVPADGRTVLDVAFAGRCASGAEGKDWRGIILVDAEQIRMSEQSAWYPQVPLSLGGPGVQRAPATLTVTAPAEMSVVATGERRSVSEPADGARTWQFVAERPVTLSLVALPQPRLEREVDGVRIVALLPEAVREHAPAVLAEAAAVLAFYRARWGAPGGQSLSIAGMRCRRGSYSWAADGLIVLDQRAFSGELPRATLAHEIAHLWWGQRVTAAGPGERFLTEGMAEWSSWRYLAARDPALALDAARSAVRGWQQLVDRDRDRALGEVTFATPSYNLLAYEKGAAVLRHATARLGEAAMDAALREYVAAAEQAGVGRLTDLRAALDGVELPWLDRAGLVQVELRDLDVRGARLHGRLVASRPGALPLAGRLAVDVLDANGRRRDWIDWASTDTDWSLAVAPPVRAVWIDPDATSLVALAPPVVLSGPRLTQSRPTAAAADVPRGGSVVELRFSEPVVVLPRAAWSGRTRRQLHGVEQVGPTHVRIETQVWRAAAELRIELGTLLEGHEGVPVDPPVFAFHTAASEDHTSPRVLRTHPSHDAVDVPAGSCLVTVEFDEVMDYAYAFPNQIDELRGRTLVPLEDVVFDRAQRVLRVTTGPLLPDTSYVLPLTNGLRDLSGNAFAGTELEFRTGPR